MMEIRLKELLRERGMSQSDLAREIGVDKNTISRWTARGRVMIQLDVLDRICTRLNVTPNDIFVQVPDEESN